MTAKTELAMIRSQLALRQDSLTNEWEVYTTLHGSGVFRWFKIHSSSVGWWRDNFPEIRIERFNVPDFTGVLDAPLS